MVIIFHENKQNLKGAMSNGVWFFRLKILVSISTNKKVKKLGTYQGNLFLQIALDLILMSFPCAWQLFIILSKTCINDRRMKEQLELHINVIFCAYIYLAATTPSSSVASLDSVSGTSPSMTI